MWLLNYVLFIFIYLRIHLATSGTVANFNEDGWGNAFSDSSLIPLYKFGDKQYYVSKFKLTFFEAYQFCENIHMKLLTVRSAEEVEALTRFVQQTGKDQDFWTSGTRLVDNINWIWMSTLEVVEYTQWSIGQPDFLGEQCIELWFAGQKQLSFNNRICNDKQAFICEKDSNRLRPARETDSKCLSNLESQYVSPKLNLLHFQGKSYYFATTFKATFLQANQFCEMLRMKLVSISSEEENKRLHKYIRDTIMGERFWTSGSKLIDGRNLVWLSTGKSVDYTNWLPGQPDNVNEMCLELFHKRNDGLFWNDRGCEEQLNFICERYEDIIITPRGSNPAVAEPKPIAVNLAPKSVEPAVQQPDNPTLPLAILDGVKYRVSHFKAAQETASQACEQYGMKLVSILDKAKNDVVSKLIEQYGNPGPNYYWTSAKKQRDGKWMWWDVQPVIDTNWASSEPNDIKNAEFCLQLYPNGQWNHLDCTNDSYFICEFRHMGSCDPNSNCCKSRPVSTVNVYVNNNQWVGSANGTQVKKIASCEDGEGCNIEVNINKGTCESPKVVEPL